MILPNHTTNNICRELMEDHHQLMTDARVRLRKELKRLYASAMSNKIIEYQPKLPSRNKWYVSANLYNRKDKTISIQVKKHKDIFRMYNNIIITIWVKEVK